MADVSAPAMPPEVTFYNTSSSPPVRKHIIKSCHVVCISRRPPREIMDSRKHQLFSCSQAWRFSNRERRCRSSSCGCVMCRNHGPLKATGFLLKSSISCWNFCRKPLILRPVPISSRNQTNHRAKVALGSPLANCAELYMHINPPWKLTWMPKIMFEFPCDILLPPKM